MKDNKGITGVDVAISIVILIIFVSVIIAMFVNIDNTRKKIERKSVATNIAIQAIETMKTMRFGDLNGTDENPMTIEKINLLTGSQIEIPDGYEASISIENYQNEDIIKIISTDVKYSGGKKEENVKIETLIKNETIIPAEPVNPDPEDKLLSVALYSGPTKTEYFPDESVNYNGIQLELTYEKTGRQTIDGKPYITSCEVNQDLANGERYTITLKYSENTFTILTYKKGWYGKTDETWYYYQDNGKKLTGDNYLPVSNNTTTKYTWFYFKEDGTMFEGWRKVDDKYKYYIATGGSGTIKELISKESIDLLITKGFTRGSMITGNWGEIYQVDGHKWFYFKADGTMCSNEWQQINDKWYYFKESGVRYSSEWLELDGKWYYFKQDGAMCQNETVTIEGKDYIFDSTGACTNK